jgi:glycine cleavage system H protein
MKYYLSTHEWCEEVEAGVFTVGISDYAQSTLGDIVYVSLPSVGDQFGFNERFGDVESVKAVSELFCPLSGEVIEVNTALDDTPELINQDALGTWLIKVKGQVNASDLMDEAAYNASDKEH